MNESRGRKIGTNKKKCEKYKLSGRLEKNKKRKAAKMARHLALAKARRARNHPEA